jgi:hypothetical protein
MDRQREGEALGRRENEKQEKIEEVSLKQPLKKIIFDEHLFIKKLDEDARKRFAMEVE